MDKVRVGMIGCGGIGSWHFSHLVEFADVELVAFCDIIESRAADFAKRAGKGKAYTCFKEMLDKETFDAIYIGVPPNCHGDIEMAVIEKGLPFLVEKPLADNMPTAEKIFAGVQAKNLITQVGFQDRYLDLTEKIIDYIKDKQVGLVSATWSGGIPGVPWWRKMTESGGQIVEQNIHLYDMARFLFGDAESVYCAGGKGIVVPDSPEYNVPGYDVDDYSSAVVKFKNGVIANVFTACYTVNGGGIRSGMNIYCKDATLEYSLRSGLRYRDANGTEEFARQADQGITEDRVFIDSIKSGDGSANRSPYSDAIKSLKLVLACNESIATGKVIML